ncbi:MAG: protein kinase [Pirellulaceae bacterium]
MNPSEVSHSRFLETLRLSNLLSAEEIKPFLDGRNLDNANDETIAREFLKAQLLTPFQAKYLLHGRWRGLVIKQYRIFEPVSVGGMGEVYLARHPESDEPVAIKILRAELRDSPRNVERFRLEAFAVMTLKHPNLLRGIEYDTVDQMKKETNYLVTEFVPGPNLYELTVIRRQLPWQQACDVAQQAALGLHHAHENGFVHRDVKPGNLILSSSGIVKVVDFGLAQYKGQDESFRFSMRKRRGTERYAAPEQSVMDQPIDPRADIYSLGCTLFFALCGRPPSDTSADLYPSSRTAIKRLLSHRDDLPEELIPIIKRMLRRKPRQRFDSMADVAQALAPLSKRMGVDVNYPGLLRARERSRRSEASWNTDAKPTMTTVPAEPQPSVDSQDEDWLNSLAAAQAEALNRNETEEAAAVDEPPDAREQLAEIYRRHRQHSDRLHQRIDALEKSLRESRDIEKELRTRINSQDIEKQQLIVEHRQIVERLCRETAASVRADRDRVIEQHYDRILSLHSQLQEASQRLEQLELRHSDQRTAMQRNHERDVKRREQQSASRKQMYLSERAKRLRTVANVNRLFAEVGELRQCVQGLKLEHLQATERERHEASLREQAEAFARSCNEQLQEVTQRADHLSVEISSLLTMLKSFTSCDPFEKH